MLQKDTPKAHLNLIRRVARIDKEAAKYMREQLKNPTEDYYPDKSLSGCFVFKKSPQGADYWLDIDNLLYNRNNRR